MEKVDYGKYSRNIVRAQQMIPLADLAHLSEDQSFIENHIKRNLAKLIADHLIKENNIEFSNWQDYDMEASVYRANLLVFTPDELVELVRDAFRGEIVGICGRRFFE